MERCKMENVAESTNDVSESWMILFLIKKRNTKVSLYYFILHVTRDLFLFHPQYHY